MIRSVLVLGEGSAAFLAALTLKCRLPDLPVTVVRSRNQDVIEVGEGSTLTFGYHLHHYCGFDLPTFYRLVQPTWKLGTRFEWGPRSYFNYVFGFELDTQFALLPQATGYFLDNTEAFEATGTQSGLMNANKIWLRQPDGRPLLAADEFSYHVESEKLAGYLKGLAQGCGISIVDDMVMETLQDEQGVTGLRLESGQTLAADLYVDASGLRSLLLGNALGEPFLSYQDSLFCDRAVWGGFERGAEPIKPYTTAATMKAGWCWQVEHEQTLHRGYVYSSSFLSDNDAEAEFRAQNPKVQNTRTVPFRQGRHERFWVKNVVGVGAAAAFVEPLEATGLAAICIQSQALAETLTDCDRVPNRSTVFNFNRYQARTLDATRDFLALHYRFNRRLETPFWRDCQAKVELHWLNWVVEFYRENGPSVLWRRALDEIAAQEFGMEGYLAMLVGLCVPYQSSYLPSEQDRQNWAKIQQSARNKVAQAFTIPEAQALVHSPYWNWPEGLYNRPRAARP